MTQENKQLLLKDLCGRLPYGVICRKDCKTADNEDFYLDKYPNPIELAKYLTIDDMDITIKPYLRPMSSMTEEEKQEMSDGSRIAFEPAMNGISGYCPETMAWSVYNVDYCISHHLDYRGLIPMGLALEAQEGMYKNE